MKDELDRPIRERSMRRVALVALLALSFAVPAFGAAHSALPVGGFAVSSSGTIHGSGTLGGVPGTLTSTPTSPTTGNWSMTVGGVPFAGGTYSCSGGGCTYVGAVVGSKAAFSFTTAPSPVALSVAIGFATHGRWVSTVGHWAARNRGALANAGLTVGNVVAAAAHSGDRRTGGALGSDHTALSDAAGISHGNGGGNGGGSGADHGSDHGRGR